MKSLTYVEIDIDYCSLTYGVPPCMAVLPTGGEKCFNTIATCQDRENFTNVPVTLRFALSTNYLPKEIDCIPNLIGVSFTPGTVSLGENLGQRASLTVTFKDHPWSDTGEGFDKYLADRDYNPYTQGTFWGKFRARQPYLRGRALRLITGLEGQALEEMETRHYIIESFDGPTQDGKYAIVAKDVLKLADGDRAQAPALSNGFLADDIDTDDLLITLSPTGIGNEEYPTSGYVAIGGKEIVSFTRDPGPGIDTDTLLMLHMEGADASTTFTDSGPSARAATANGNVQIDTAQSVFGSSSALFDGTGDYISFADNAAWTQAGNFTIECRARFASLAAARTLACHSTDINNMYRLFVTAAGALSFVVISASITTITLTSADGLITVNQWYHIAIVRNGNVFKLYIDGVEVATVTDADALPNFTSTFKIGISGNGSSDPMNGWIDEFRFSKKAVWTDDFTVPDYSYNDSSDILNLTARAQLGTEANSHNSQDRAQLVIRYVGETPVAIISDLLENYAGVDASLIPFDDWLFETTNFLNSLYTGTIAEPTSVNQLISELIEQAALAVWWSDTDQEIKLQVLRSIVTTAQVFNSGNRLAGSFASHDQPDKRLSQIWTYFGQRDPLKRQDDPDNYRSTAATVDLESQTDYGAPAIKKIFSRWIPAFGRAVALRLNDILISRFRVPPRRFNFAVHRYHGNEEVHLGGGYRLEDWTFQDETGALVDVPIQVTRLKPLPEKVEVEAEEMLFTEIEGLTDRIIIIDVDDYNLNLREIHDTIYADPVDGDVVICIIEDDVIVGSLSTDLVAFTVGDWPSGVSITFQIYGRIQGAGGAGGKGGTWDTGGFTPELQPQDGGDGGDALYTRVPIDIEFGDDGEIWSGGGGGGGGAANDSTGHAGGGGGGGAGTIPGPLGSKGSGNGSPADGQIGTSENNGAGGRAGGGSSGAGGDGGDPGIAGQDGGGADDGNDGAEGGLAGTAIDGVSYVTFVTGPAGDIRGAQIN